MNIENFYNSLENLSSYFNKELSPRQKEFYFADLKYITTENFNYTIREIIKKSKPTPYNFPTISDIKGLCPQDQPPLQWIPDESEDRYYRRIKVDHLFTALKTLTDNGVESFKSYHRSNHFTAEDVERVWFKFKINDRGKPEDLASDIGGNDF